MGRKIYGSITNRIEEGNQYGREIFIGMGATEYLFSDCHPYEVIKIIDKKHVVVREMNYKRTDGHGMSDSQEYDYTSNPQGYTCSLTMTKSGWRSRINGKYGNYFALGVMRRYYDFSF